MIHGLSSVMNQLLLRMYVALLSIDTGAVTYAGQPSKGLGCQIVRHGHGAKGNRETETESRLPPEIISKGGQPITHSAALFFWLLIFLVLLRSQFTID